MNVARAAMGSTVVLLLAGAVVQAANGPITTIAGTVDGLAGDGGPATSARLSRPQGMVVTADGATLIADAGNHRVRRVAADGRITTLAGTTQGLAGDGGPAASAQLDTPRDVAVLSDGSAIVADAGNGRVRRIDGAGNISTIAGTTPGLAGDGGPARSAQLRQPSEFAPLPGGGFLVADTGNHRIRKVDAAGIITTVAGTSQGFFGDGGPATAAQLNSPSGVALTEDGGFLIADSGNHRIRKVDAAGVITTLAGIGVSFAGDGGLATRAGLDTPSDVIPLSNGGFLVADTGNDRIRRVTPLGTIFTIAGGRRGLADTGQATFGRLDSPSALFPTAGGPVLVGDSGNSRVRRLTDAGALPSPDPLRSISVTPANGSVTVQPARTPAFLPLREADLTPNVSNVDATAGQVNLLAELPDDGEAVTAEASGGRFQVVQQVADQAAVDLRLNQPLACPKGRASNAREHAGPPQRRLRVRVRGRYRTTGRHAAAVANGTAWTITDRCDRTIIRVTEGTVTVRDFRLNRLVKVRAGSTYVALATAPKKKPRRP